MKVQRVCLTKIPFLNPGRTMFSSLNLPNGKLTLCYFNTEGGCNRPKSYEKTGKEAEMPSKEALPWEKPMKTKLLQTLCLPLRKTTERTRNSGLPSSIVHRGSQIEVSWGLQTQVEDTEKYIFSWLTGGSNEPLLPGNFFFLSQKK